MKKNYSQKHNLQSKFSVFFNTCETFKIYILKNGMNTI